MLGPAPSPTGEVQFAVDDLCFDADARRLHVRGWAFPSTRPLFRRNTDLVLIGPDGAYRIETRPMLRPDIRKIYGASWLARTGFYQTATVPPLPAGDYLLGLSLKCGKWLEDVSNALHDLRPTPAPAFQAGHGLDTLEQLDNELRQMAAMQQRSHTEWVSYGALFHLKEDVHSLPSDPLSSEYRDTQLALYRRVSGRNGYSPWKSEPVEIAVEQSADPYPFPYATHDAGFVGSHMIAMGHILRTLKAAVPGARSVLEYGCGTGFTTIILAQTGFDVVAVDINATALQVVDRLAATRSLPLTTFNGEFGQVPESLAGRRWDVVLFYESFHHCLGFVDLLKRLQQLVSDDGAVVFAGEPVSAELAKPWGLRLDGLSLWEIRTKGWLELGFRESFFFDVLSRTGWDATKHVQENAPDIYVAKRKRKNRG